MQVPVRDLRNASITPVASLEVQVGSPIIREVVCEIACGARCKTANISARNCKIKGVASNDLMHMSGRKLVRIDERIDAVNDDLRASKSQQN